MYCTFDGAGLNHLYFQILESFKKFGMGDKDEAVFVVIVNDEKDKVLEDVKSRIMGTEVPVEECEDMAILDLIKKVT